MTSGHRPASSPRGLFGFCLASSKGVPKFKSSKVQCSVLSVLSVVKEKCSLRGHNRHFGVNCPIGVCLTLWYYLIIFGKKEGFTDIAISFCVFPLILYAEKIAQLRAGNLARLAHR